MLIKSYLDFSSPATKPCKQNTTLKLSSKTKFAVWKALEGSQI